MKGIIVCAVVGALMSCSKEDIQNAELIVVEPKQEFSSVIYLDMDGETVKQTAWNEAINYRDIVCAPAEFTVAQRQAIYDSVRHYFRQFRVHITTREDVYNKAAPDKRLRVIITPTSEWTTTQESGIAYTNSYNVMKDAPVFVFSNHTYNVRNTAIIAAHEAGHAYGLQHHVLFSDYILISQYDWGTPTDGPIMGDATHAANAVWGKGTTAAFRWQDDVSMLNEVLP